MNQRFDDVCIENCNQYNGGSQYTKIVKLQSIPFDSPFAITIQDDLQHNIGFDSNVVAGKLIDQPKRSFC